MCVVVAVVGIVMPNSTALALTDHPDAAGSASALLGALQFLIGACVALLVGVAGKHTAVPMAATIAVLTVGGVGAMALLTRRQAPAAARATSEAAHTPTGG